MNSPLLPGSGRRRWACGLAGTLLGLAYGCHTYLCADSALFYFPYLYLNSDMHANLLWAKSILEQGWLNPNPHHPFVDWMRGVGTQEEWLHWWGGGAIFQQAPLYAYLLALVQTLSDDLIYVFLLQALFAMWTCLAVGMIAARLAGRPREGWIAFGLAALYAPFYTYSQALLRDLLGWTVTATLLSVLLGLDSSREAPRRRLWLALATGLLLGLGLLSREIYVLVLPLVSAACLWRLVEQRAWTAAAALAFGLGIVLLPLVIRNHRVGAPLFSTSNRSAEAIIQGHASTAHPYLFVIPQETRRLLEKGAGRTTALLVETIKTHPGLGHWVHFEWIKVLSLLDPFESYDNLSPYFVEAISPFARWGVKHWMIIIPGFGGLVLSVWRRDRRHFWLWLLLPVLLLNVYVGVPLSRYRQILALLWIPWAAYLAGVLIEEVRRRSRLALALATSLVAGWCLCLGPMARQPRAAYERRTEYEIAVQVYERLGKPARAEEMKRLLREKFGQ